MSNSTKTGFGPGDADKMWEMLVRLQTRIDFLEAEIRLLRQSAPFRLPPTEPKFATEEARDFYNSTFSAPTSKPSWHDQKAVILDSMSKSEAEDFLFKSKTDLA